MKLLIIIALRHLLARKRQSIVSLLGIILGVAFFLAISALMQGSENDFMKRLVDNSPHITISDEFRDPRIQPVQKLYEGGAIDLRGIKPVTETRGLRGYKQILSYLRTVSGLRASPVLAGQVIVSFAGQDSSLSLSGMIPAEIATVSTIQNYMVQGKVENLIANPNGVIIGAQMAKRFGLDMGDNLTVTSPAGIVKVFKIVGIFKTGRGHYDEEQGFADLRRVQVLMNKPNRANSIIIKIDTPQKARDIAKTIEARIGYKAMSWQESSEDLMNTFAIRNRIMYTVVSAVLLVAAFGIYNVISTVVMEKQKDIAILKSMGFLSSDIRRIFLVQGILLGLAGNFFGLPLGCGFMFGLAHIKFKPPGASDVIFMPLSWGWEQFAIAASFAMIAAMIAAFMPARKAAKVHPVDILRGGL